MPLSLTLSDALAAMALLVSSYATWKTVRFNERQKSLIESQERLNKRLLVKEEEDSIIAKKADLGATFIKLDNNNYRLKVWNKGRSAARDVQLDFPEGNECIVQSDIESKFPLEVLEPYQSVELIAAVGLDTKAKQPITLHWSDGFSSSNQKTVHPTI